MKLVKLLLELVVIGNWHKFECKMENLKILEHAYSITRGGREPHNVSVIIILNADSESVLS